MVFNAPFNNISALLWQSVLLVEETGGPRENHWPVTSHWQTLLKRNLLDRMVVGFTTTYAISAYHHWCWEFESRSGRGLQHYAMRFVSDLWQVGKILHRRTKQTLQQEHTLKLGLTQVLRKRCHFLLHQCTFVPERFIKYTVLFRHIPSFIAKLVYHHTSYPQFISVSTWNIIYYIFHQ
jgi:hypothetical protein